MPVEQKLSSARRIKKRRDYLRLQSGKSKIKSRYFLIAIEKKQLDSKEESRLGVTITKKVDKRAVKRNSLKRKLREFFRKNRIHFQRIVDLVIIAQSGASELSSAEIEQDLKEALTKARLLKN